jgi:DNA helicase-2/ATP-dependent DNA helicase PcrA
MGVASRELAGFMEWLALRSDLDSLVDGDAYVTLMTVHSAKGLEFPVVFIAGMEDSIFPHYNAATSEAGIEEERRLAYVAITRARELLYMTYARVRSLYGNVQANPQSTFIGEVPTEYVRLCGVGSDGFRGTGWEKRGDRHGTFGSGTAAQTGGHVFGSGARHGGVTGAGAAAGGQSAEKLAEQYAVGDLVDHKTFGRGAVTKVDGDVLYIRFERSRETKKLLKGYAPIVRLEK